MWIRRPAEYSRASGGLIHCLYKDKSCKTLRPHSSLADCKSKEQTLIAVSNLTLPWDWIMVGKRPPPGHALFKIEAIRMIIKTSRQRCEQDGLSINRQIIRYI